MTQRLEKIHVVCICGGIGFPKGGASSHRILHLGKGLIEAGVQFKVLHIGPSVVAENASASGRYSGIEYQYLPSVVKASPRRLIRMLYYGIGGILLPFRLFCYHRSSIAYIYYQGSILGLWAMLCCKLLRVPLIQEACEWWVGVDKASRFVRFMYLRVMFRWSDCALAISKSIEERIKQVSAPKYPVFRLPVLIDVNRVSLDTAIRKSRLIPTDPYFLWCGSLDAYKEETLFLLKAFRLVKVHKTCSAKLVLVGPTSDWTRRQMEANLNDESLSHSDVLLPGYVAESDLQALAQTARALLLPMWNNPRSQTRFPTKAGLYVSAGRPIITAAVGSIAEHFDDRETAMFYTVGSADSMGDVMVRLLEDPALADLIGREARMSVLPKFDYREQGRRFRTWLEAHFSLAS